LTPGPKAATDRTLTVIAMGELAVVPEDHLAVAGAAGFLGLSAWGAGDLETAVETFSETVRSLHAAGHIADELGSTVPFAQMRTSS